MGLMPSSLTNVRLEYGSFSTRTGRSSLGFLFFQVHSIHVCIYHFLVRSSTAFEADTSPSCGNPKGDHISKQHTRDNVAVCATLRLKQSNK